MIWPPSVEISNKAADVIACVIFHLHACIKQSEPTQNIMNPNDNAKSKGGMKKKASKGTLIDHTYYDFSTRELSELLPDEADSDEKPIGRVTFPMKLHAILSGPNYQHIIRWMPHGRSWKILDNDMLASVVCPENFNHSSYDSFNRSVNGWGFKVCHFFLPCM